MDKKFYEKLAKRLTKKTGKTHVVTVLKCGVYDIVGLKEVSEVIKDEEILEVKDTENEEVVLKKTTKTKKTDDE